MNKLIFPSLLNRNILTLLFILFIASFLRLYNIFYVPPSASLDEVSIGYNAYSVLKTGGDEYGNKFPLLLRAYDDWRPALYVYLVAPFVQIFGLDVLAVRLPSIILSALTVIATYFLVRELFAKRETTLALLSGLLLAISPWHVYISRLGHEANAGFAFVVFATLFFVKTMNNLNNKFYLFISAIFFSLSLYTYQSEKVFVPLLIISLVVLYRKELLRIKKYFLLSLIIFIIFTVPIFVASLSPNALIRFSGTSVFSNHPLYVQNAKKFIKAKESNDIVGQIINNRKFTSFYIFASQYLSHPDPKWLFQNSGNESFKAPNVGLFYFWQLPLMLIGIIIFILTKKFLAKTKVIVILWIAFSFIAPAITTEVPHAMRAYNVLPAFILMIAVGLVEGMSLIKEGSIKKTSILLITVIAVIEFINFSRSYFVLFPKYQSDSFQYALSKAIPFVLDNEKHYDRVIFSNEKNLYQSYMFFLFYSKYDPVVYQKEGGTKSGGFAEIHSFDKYEFRPIKWEKENKDPDIVYIGNNEDFPENVETIKTVNYLNGELRVKIVEGN